MYIAVFLRGVSHLHDDVVDDRHSSRSTPVPLMPVALGVTRMTGGAERGAVGGAGGGSAEGGHGSGACVRREDRNRARMPLWR